MTKDWKFYTGMVFLALSIAFPLLGFLVPLFNFPPAISALIIGAFVVGGPEVMMILAVAFLGKNMVHFFKEKFFRFFKNRKFKESVSKFRYYFGLTIMILSGAPLYFSVYFTDLVSEDKSVRYIILLGADVLFVISFFIIGSDFWEKFKRLFIWESSRGESPSQ